MIIQYAVFRTAWGWAGLSGDGVRVRRLVLPQPDADLVRQSLWENVFAPPVENPGLFVVLQRQIQDYFSGHPISHWDAEIDWSGYSSFATEVLKVVQNIPYGEYITYGEAALRAGFPRAARAVGQVLKRNRTPLLIPCHRVLGSIRSGKDRLVGFTAPGGILTKKALLELESVTVRTSPCNGQRSSRS